MLKKTTEFSVVLIDAIMMGLKDKSLEYYDKDDLVIFDRGYPSYGLFANGLDSEMIRKYVKHQDRKELKYKACSKK